MDPVAGETREARRLLQREVHFAGRSFDLEVFNPSYEIRGKIRFLDELQESPFRVGAGGDHFRVELLPRRDFYPDRASVSNEDSSHLGIHANLRAKLPSRTCDRLADHPHPPADVAPGAIRAIDFSHVVVHEHVRGAGGPGP